MADQHTPFDTRLERALGVGSLSPEQRRRHLERIAVRSRTGRSSAGRLLRDGALVAVLIALLAGAWLLLPLGESSDSEIDPMAAIASFREDVADPGEPEEARFIQIRAETFIPGPFMNRDTLEIDVWERIKENGFVERSIMSYDTEGNLQGRAVEFEDRWIFELPGFWDEASAGTLMFPPELGQAIGAVQFSEAETLRNQLDEILALEDVDAEERDGELIIRARDADFDAGYLDSLSEDLGFTATAVIMEHSLDLDRTQRVGWAFAVEDEHGDVHEIQRIEVSRWETVDPSDIPEDAFAERTPLADEEIGHPLPERIETSLGTLEISDVEMRSSTSGLVTYLGPAPLLIEVRISPLNEEIDTEHPDVHPIAIPGIDGYWIADQLQDEWPRRAVWVDDGLEFNLNARNLPEGGWNEDDLYEVIEAIVDHSAALT